MSKRQYSQKAKEFESNNKNILKNYDSQVQFKREELK